MLSQKFPFSLTMAVAIAGLCLAGTSPLCAALTVTELQSSNKTTLLDEDGDTPDWIELHNPDAVPLDLAGYKLVENDPEGWTFPAMVLPPGGYLVVFASGKDRKDTAKPLHTNFSLKGQGTEGLTLLNAAGESIWSNAELPDLESDFSSGSPPRSVTETMLVSTGSDLLWAPESVPSKVGNPKWAAPSFVPTDWRKGKNGLLWQRSAAGLELRRLAMAPQITSMQQMRLALGRPQFSKPTGWWSVPWLNFASTPEQTETFPKDRLFPPDGPVFPSESVIYQAKGSVTFSSAGKWTLAFLNTNGDSSAIWSWKIGDNVFSSEGGGGIIIDPRPIDPGLIDPRPRPIPLLAEARKIRPPSSSFVDIKTLNLKSPGSYAVEVTWAASPKSKAAVEFSAAKGEFSEINSKFALLGSNSLPLTHSPTLSPDLTVGTRITDRKLLSTAKSLVARIPFYGTPVPDLPLRLKIRYTDGFRAWIDGKLVAERNAPIGRSTAVAARSVDAIATWDTFDLAATSIPPLPRTKPHLLTIQVLRAADQASHCYVEATLSALSPTGQGQAPPLDGYFTTPSPGQENGPALAASPSEPDVSLKRGSYPTAISVGISSNEPTGKIFYTLDGSSPKPGNQMLYTGPLTITKSTVLSAYVAVAGKLPSRTIVHSYLIADTQATQDGAGLPTTWEGAAAKYAFASSQLPDAASKLPASLRSLPSISLTLPPEQFFGSSGLHANSDVRGPLSAYTGSAEWLFPNSGIEWREKADIRIKGEASRGSGFAKHGFRLEFGSGAGNAHHLLFNDSERKRYNVIMLHGSYVDNILTLGKQAQYIRDLWARDTLRLMGHPAAHGDFCHLYLNGLYWGLYHAGERCDAQWCAHYFGGLASDWDVRDSEKVIDGDLTGYDALVSTSAKENPTQADYDYLSARLDLASFIDYMLVNFYAANTDWPGHNWYAARDRRSGVWRYLSWDAEYSFDRPNDRSFTDFFDSSGYGDPGQIFRFMLGSASFRSLVDAQLQKHLGPNGVLSEAIAKATWGQRADTIAPAVLAEYARWADVASAAVTVADWQAERTRLETKWFPTRAKFMRRQLQGNGVLSDVAAPSISPQGGPVAPNTQVTIANTASNATLYYTLDGTDPNGADGQPAATAIPYTAPLTISPPATVRSRGWYDGLPSPLTEAVFLPTNVPLGLKIAEFHFRPVPAGAEFVRIINPTSRRLDLTGVQLRGGIRYTFPDNTIINVGASMILARDLLAYDATYTTHGATAAYTGALADEGEHLVLSHPAYGLLDEVFFRPSDPWPTGTGSLHRVDYGNIRAFAWEIAAPLTYSPPRPGGDPPPIFLSGSPGIPQHHPTNPIGGPPATISGELVLGNIFPVTPNPFALNIQPQAGNLHLSWSVQPGYTYELQQTRSFSVPWETVLTMPSPTSVQEHQETLPLNSTSPSRFFRVMRRAVP